MAIKSFLAYGFALFFVCSSSLVAAGFIVPPPADPAGEIRFQGVSPDSTLASYRAGDLLEVRWNDSTQTGDYIDRLSEGLVTHYTDIALQAIPTLDIHDHRITVIASGLTQNKTFDWTVSTSGFPTPYFHLLASLRDENGTLVESFSSDVFNITSDSAATNRKLSTAGIAGAATGGFIALALVVGVLSVILLRFRPWQRRAKTFFVRPAAKSSSAFPEQGQKQKGQHESGFELPARYKSGGPEGAGVGITALPVHPLELA